MPFENEKVVFIAGVGPRTGTTLMQRIINAHPDAWIWGEPGRYAEVQLTQVWQNMNDWRAAFKDRDKFLYRSLNEGNKLEFAWASAMIPSENRLWQAWRAFFEVGFRTKRIWGFKTVGCVHLDFMRYLFPNAYILVAIRNPLDQYKSYRTGINNTEPPIESIANLKSAYEGYERVRSESDLLLNLDTFDADRWTENIFGHLDEPVPLGALQAARIKIRGPVPEPLDYVPPTIRDLIHQELDPLYEHILEVSHA